MSICWTREVFEFSFRFSVYNSNDPPIWDPRRTVCRRWKGEDSVFVEMTSYGDFVLSSQSVHRSWETSIKRKESKKAGRRRLSLKTRCQGDDLVPNTLLSLSSLTIVLLSLKHAQPLNGLLVYPRGSRVPNTLLFVAADRFYDFTITEFQQMYVLDEIYEENDVERGQVSPVNRKLLARASDKNHRERKCKGRGVPSGVPEEGSS